MSTRRAPSRYWPLLFVAVALGSAPAAALSVNASNQTVTVGSAVNISASVTYDALLATHSWTIEKVPFVANSMICPSSNTSYQEVPGGMRISASGTRNRNATISWPAEENRYGAGVHCIRIQVCEHPESTFCSKDHPKAARIIKVTAEKPTFLYNRPQSYVHRAGDSRTISDPLPYYNHFVSPTSTAASLLDLVSCPSGAICSPPALPSWVGTQLISAGGTGNSGLRITWLPPAGTTTGTWRFRAKPQPQPVENEDNDSVYRPDYFAPGATISGQISPLADQDHFAFRGRAGETVVVSARTSTALTLCSPDILLTLLRYNGGTSWSTLTSDATNSGTNCARISYTLPTDAEYSVRVQENGNNATVSYYYLSLSGVSWVDGVPPVGSSDETFAFEVNDAGAAFVGQSTPSWNNEVESVTNAYYYSGLFHHSGATGDTSHKKVYGRCDSGIGAFLEDRSVRADYYALYSDGTTTSQCGVADAFERDDGYGACRSSTGEIGDEEYAPDVLLQERPEGTLFGYLPRSYTLSRLGSANDKVAVNVFAYQGDRSPISGAAHFVWDGTRSKDTVVEIDPEYGGNDVLFEPWGQCSSYRLTAKCKGSYPRYNGGGTNPPPDPGCVMDKAFFEGDRVRMELKRYNQRLSGSAVALQRCTSFSDTVCGQSLLGASYDAASDEFRWDVPYTATTSTTRFYFRVFLNGTETSPYNESNAYFWIVFDVKNRAAFSASGPDLYVRALRERYPQAYTTIPPSVIEEAVSAHVSTSDEYKQWDEQARYYLTNTFVGRTLAEGDVVPVHANFEDTSIGDGKGATSFYVNLYNRGNATGGATYVDAFLRPVSLDASGNYQSTPPASGEAPIDTQYISAVAAGAQSLYTMSLQADDLLLHWSSSNVHAGTPRALYLSIRQSATYGETTSSLGNNVLGPFFFVPPPPPPESTLRSESRDLYGTFLSVSDESPTSGSSLAAYVQVKNRRGLSSVSSKVSFYDDQPSAPTSGTTAYASQSLPSTIGTNETLAYTFTIAAADLQKPNRSNNTLYLRAFIDPANTVIEDLETNNQLPTTSTAFEVEIENTPPAFTSAPTSSELLASEGQEWRLQLQLAEIDDVDQSRLALSLVSGPTAGGGDDGTMALEGSLAGCGSDFFCQDLVWTPGDAQASAGTADVTVRVCDKDPVAIAAGSPNGACDELAFTLVVARVNDAPVFTAAPTAESTLNATEDEPWSYDLDAIDEEDGSTLSYSLVTAPGGMTINASTGEVAWTPGDVAAGKTRTVTVRATDQGTGGTPRSVTRRFYISVANVNDAPVLGAPSSTSASEDVAWSSRLRFTDADVDVSVLTQTLSCSLGTSTPAWVTSVALVVDTGLRYCQVGGTPDNADTGTPTIYVRASDGITTTERSFTVTVADAPASPSFVSSPGTQSATQGSQWSLGVTATDEDFNSPAASESLSWSRVSGPGVTITPALDTKSATLTWTPPASAANTSPTLIIRITDATSRTADLAISFGTIGNINDAPYFTSVPPSIALSEGQGFEATHKVAASDPDKDAGYTEPLTFSIVSALDAATGTTSLPGLGIGASSGALAWTTGDGNADDAQVGSWIVTVRVSDDESPTPANDDDTFTLSVSNVNDPPVLDAIGNQSVNEDALLTLELSSSDEDGTTPTLSATGLPAGASFTDHGDGSATFSWTPTTEQAGNYDVTFRASDGSASDQEIVTISVGNVNRPPILAAIGNKVVNEDVELRFTASASDPDGTVPSFSISGKPASATFTDHGDGTATFVWTPSASGVGVHNLTIAASDGAAIDDEAFTITVNDVNYPPVWEDSAPLGTVSGSEGSLVSFTMDASDTDGPSALSYSVTGLPTGASYSSSTGAFSWTPGYDQAGARELEFEASDGAAIITRALTLDIANTDRPPVISGPTSSAAAEGETVSFSISASDPDGDVTTLVVHDAGGAGGSLSGGAYTWLTGYADAGSYDVVFRATAGAATTDHTVTVTIADTNRPPLVTSTPGTSATEDQPYGYTITATDPDGDAFTLAFVSGPTGASLDTATGVLSWTPTGAQVGSRDLHVRLSDGKAGGVTDHFWSVNVVAVNDAPVLTSTPLTSATEDSTYSYQAAASDEEGEALSWSLTTAPADMTISQSGLVSWLPKNAGVGSHAVTVRVADPGGESDSQSFTVTVANTNDAPTISDDAPSVVLEDATWTWTPTVSDVDVGDSATLAFLEGPLGMTLVSGTLSWAPENDDVGDHTVRVSATDVAGAVTTRTVTVTVQNRNDAPFFVSSPLDVTMDEGTTLARLIDADDVDLGDELSYSLIGAPATAEIDVTTGAFTFRPDDAEVGTRDFTLRVEDTAGAYAEQDARIVVIAVNDAPVLAPIGSRQVDIDATLTITLSATDVDGPSLSYSGQGLPAGGSLSANVFSWTPGIDDAGAHSVTFVVSDGTLSDSEGITIIVGDGGFPPALDIPADATVDEGDLLAASVSASDPDGGSDPIALAAEDLPTGATFTDHGDGTGSFSWTPGYGAAGSYPVTFTATNPSGQSRGTWNITVGDTNRPPVISTLVLPAATENQLFEAVIEASDPDADALSFSLVQGPSGLVIDATTGTLSLTPAFGHVGQHDVLVRASDGKGGAHTRTFTLLVAFEDSEDDGLPDTWERSVGLDVTSDDALLDPDSDGLSNLAEYQGGTDPFVSNAPSPPLLLAPADAARVDTATPTLAWQESTDPDNDPLSYTLTLTLLATGAQVLVVADVVAAGDEVTFTVVDPLVEGEQYRWRVVASDGIGTSPAATRTFTVDAVNEPPPAPTLVSPFDGASVATTSPTLVVNPVVDPDGDAVSYRFRLLAAADQPPVVESEAIAASVSGTVRYPLPLVLADDSTWLWEASATDVRGLTGTAGGLWTFSVTLSNLPPPAPALIAPALGSKVSELPSAIRFGTVEDPEGQPVSYLVEMAPDPTFSSASVETFSGLVSVDGVEVSLPLSADREDGDIYWRAFASDGATYGEALEAWFEIDTADTPPAAPALLSPTNNSLIDDTVLMLVAEATVDPEGEDVVSFTFELTDPDGVAVLASLSDVLDVDDGTEDGEVSASFDNLTAGQRYGWRVRALEEDGASSDWSALFTFRIAGGNARPEAPLLVSPEAGAVLTSADLSVLFEAAMDADGDEVLHDVEVYLDEALHAVGETLAADDDGMVRFALPVPLSSGQARWRARGRDTGGAGPWAEHAFTVELPDAGVPSDAGSLPGDDGGVSLDDAGEPITDDGGIVDPGHPKDPGAVATDVGYQPQRLPASCACSGSGVRWQGDALLFGALAALLLGLRRRRRR